MKSAVDSELKVLLLSIRPNHAEKIVNGTKSVELRRRKPRMEGGGVALIYASAPTQALIGEVQILSISEARPQDIWAKVREKAALTKEDFDEYFKGADRAVAIEVGNVRKFTQPITLTNIRVAISDFRPPQSFRYVDQETARTLIQPRDRSSVLT